MTGCVHVIPLGMGDVEAKTAHRAPERCIYLDHVVGIGLSFTGRSQQPNRPSTGKENGNTHGHCDHDLKELTHCA